MVDIGKRNTEEGGSKKGRKEWEKKRRNEMTTKTKGKLYFGFVQRKNRKQKSRQC